MVLEGFEFPSSPSADYNSSQLKYRGVHHLAVIIRRSFFSFGEGHSPFDGGHSLFPSGQDFFRSSTMEGEDLVINYKLWLLLSRHLFSCVSLLWVVISFNPHKIFLYLSDFKTPSFETEAPPTFPSRSRKVVTYKNSQGQTVTRVETVIRKADGEKKQTNHMS